MPDDVRMSYARPSSLTNDSRRLSAATSRASLPALTHSHSSSSSSHRTRASSRPISAPTRSVFSVIAERPSPSRSWVSRASRSCSRTAASSASSSRSAASRTARPVSQASPYTSSPNATAVAVAYTVHLHQRLRHRRTAGRQQDQHAACWRRSRRTRPTATGPRTAAARTRRGTRRSQSGAPSERVLDVGQHRLRGEGPRPTAAGRRRGRCRSAVAAARDRDRR